MRLRLGEMEDATIFAEDPAAQAESFVKEGAQYLHLVDLNGAFAGKSINTASIQAILRKVKIPCQLGGGIRSLEQIDYWLGQGIDRIILGSAALAKPEMVKEAARLYPKKIVVGLDTRKGMVASDGWAKQSHVKAHDLARNFEDAGIAALIHTDIDRDGILAGLNFAASVELAHQVTIPVIASGGCKSLEDIRILQKTNLAGAIIGRALYTGGIKLSDALEILHA